jgi:hypothetical protein
VRAWYLPGTCLASERTPERGTRLPS